MRIAIGADHGGFPLNEDVIGELKRLGHEVKDFGTHEAKSSDYPDFALAVGKSVHLQPLGEGVGQAANQHVAPESDGPGEDLAAADQLLPEHQHVKG